MGVVHHGVVSVTTGLYLGGHVASRGESTLDCVNILLRALSGESVDSRTSVPNLLCWDRGYGGTSGEVNQRAMAVGADLLGTAKRIRSFPFTFSQAPYSGQECISESGSQSAYWSKRLFPNNTQMYALAY